MHFNGRTGRLNTWSTSFAGISPASLARPSKESLKAAGKRYKLPRGGRDSLIAPEEIYREGRKVSVRRPEVDGYLLTVRDVQKVLTGRVNRFQAGDCVARKSRLVSWVPKQGGLSTEIAVEPARVTSAPPFFETGAAPR